MRRLVRFLAFLPLILATQILASTAETKSLIDQLLQEGITLTLESPSEWGLVAAHASRLSQTPDSGSIYVPCGNFFIHPDNAKNLKKALTQIWAQCLPLRERPTDFANLEADNAALVKLAPDAQRVHKLSAFGEHAYLAEAVMDDTAITVGLIPEEMRSSSSWKDLADVGNGDLESLQRAKQAAEAAFFVAHPERQKRCTPLVIRPFQSHERHMEDAFWAQVRLEVSTLRSHCGHSRSAITFNTSKPTYELDANFAKTMYPTFQHELQESFPTLTIEGQALLRGPLD